MAAYIYPAGGKPAFPDNEVCMNSYEAKLEARRARYEELAEKAEGRSNSAYKRADLREEVSGIPFGQPILVGHHSEGRHRAAIKRAENAMRKSVEESKKAAYYRGKAAGVGTGGISSDDPDAPAKLREKLEAAEADQTFMREANKLVRKALKNADIAERGADAAAFADYLAGLRALRPNWPATAAANLLKKDFAGRFGFADYQLSNNSANIKRMKDRLAQLERAAERETVESELQGVCKLVENAEENRVQLIFPGKPEANTRALLKSWGFRWSPSNGAWQRHLNNAGRFAAGQVIKKLTEE